MVISSLVRGEISVTWKRRNVLLVLWRARGTPELYAAALCGIAASGGN